MATRKNKLSHAAKGWWQLALATLLFAGLFYFGREQAVHLAWLLFAGAVVALLALFAYLPVFKRMSLYR
jgi:amino acid permease